MLQHLADVPYRFLTAPDGKARSSMARSALTAILLLLGLSSCVGLTDPDEDDSTCPQTYEFGNHGCAKLVVLPGILPPQSPSPYVWKVSAQGESAATFEAGRDSWPEEVRLHLTLMSPLPGDADVDSVTVVAEILDDSGPRDVGVPLLLVAVDSVRLSVRFAPVGGRPTVDTVRLGLSAPSG